MTTVNVRPVVKPAFIRELGPVDTSELTSVVARTSDTVWNLEDSRKENRFEVLHHTKHVVFRFIEGNRDHRRFYSNPIWDLWQRFLMPVMEAAVRPYQFRQPVFPKVMLARLAPGRVIDKHTDGLGSNLYTHKIHVPIQTNDQAWIDVSNRRFHLSPGHAYELNNLAPHGAENAGATDRIHLILEVYESEASATD
jgi:hypothetical protein